MKILGLDTSTKILALSISENGCLIIENNSDSDARHGEGIVSAISKLLNDADLKLDDINGFILGVGPGSFTGLRVGVSVIKGFCLVRKCRVLPISSLDLIAYNGMPYCRNLCVLVDAKQEKVYSCLYRVDTKLNKISPYLLCSVEEAIKKARKSFQGKILFLGDGIRIYQDRISHSIKEAVFAEEDRWYSKGRALGVLGWPSFCKKATKNLNKINPLYLYPKECQIKKY